MRKLILLAVLPLCATAAQGQRFDPRDQGAAMAVTQARITNLEASQSPRPSRLECLTRIRDKRTVCHTRREWQAIARRMAARD